MPDRTLTVRWPDRTEQTYYSPSPVVHAFLTSGAQYSPHQFLHRSRRAYRAAARDLHARYGFDSPDAEAVLAILEHDVHRHAGSDPVTVVG